MKIRMAFAFVCLPGVALGQADELPSFAYDMVSDVTLATTAEAYCDGITTRPAKMQTYIIQMYTRLSGEGVSAVDAAKHFESEHAVAEISARDLALRKRHGVAAEGNDALCDAVRAETKVNRPFAKLLRIR